MGHYGDSGLVILGRKRDILIQAGTKYFLSDLDLILNEQFPDVRGRACALAQWSEREGTEHPLFLVERQRFFDASDLAGVTSAVRAAGNLNHFELALRPTLIYHEDLIRQDQPPRDLAPMAGGAGGKVEPQRPRYGGSAS